MATKIKLSNTEIFGLVGLAALLYFAYSKGVFSPEKGRQINPENTVTDNSTATLSQNQYTNKATSIYNTVTTTASGLGGGFGQVLEELNGMNQTDLIGVANEYAKKYPNSEFKTLYSLINAEYTWAWSSTYYLKYEVLEKLSKLGLG